ncbi:MAG TPA: YXWGXW repeat-containing protein, partial [Silvibacterium sp.]|nr:YXWGXW repeat-containing protein [Silvibacterium sp.]
MPDATDVAGLVASPEVTGIQRDWRKIAMKTFPHLNVLFLSILSTGFVLCGCHGNQQQVSANSAAQADQPSNDPATANLAPVAGPSAPGDNGSYAPSGQDTSYQAPSPEEYAGEYSGQSDDSADESYYGVEPVDTAPEPPPPLPDYDQPPCPGDDYMWTPGYWDYASTGYYWVPGVWVQAPY